jgi:hypothetical protein
MPDRMAKRLPWQWLPEGSRHMPAEHTEPPLQSASVLHDVLHASEFAHAKSFGHVADAPAKQRPFPSHVLTVSSAASQARPHSTSADG